MYVCKYIYIYICVCVCLFKGVEMRLHTSSTAQGGGGSFKIGNL